MSGPRPDSEDVTALLQAWRTGEAEAGEALLERINDVVFAAETLLARIAANSGRLGEAEDRLRRLGQDAESRPNLHLRSHFLVAAAQVDLAGGRRDAARVRVEAAIRHAEATGRRLDQLAFRLELAAIDHARGLVEQGMATARAVEREAASAGLAGLARRAATFPRGGPG
jgi:hypothetical protein